MSSKSDMVRGMLFGADFFTTLHKEVEKVGGDDGMIYYALKTDSDLIPKIAKMVAEKGTKSLARLLIKLKLSSLDGRITDENFPAQPEDEDTDRKEYKLYDVGVGRRLSLEAALSEMRTSDYPYYHPATIRETLEWAVNNWNGKDWIVILGSPWHDKDGDAFFPELHRLDGSILTLKRSDGYGLSDFQHFLGVCKR